MMNCRFLLMLVFAVSLSGIGIRSAFAEIMQINPLIDNSIYAENENSNGLGGLFVGRTAGTNGTTIRRALLQFDIANSVPVGATINSVTLRLDVAIARFNAPPSTLSLHPITAAWGEGTSFETGAGASPTLNDATWNFRLYNTATWNTPGGDFGPSSGTLPLSNDFQFTVPSQAGMVSDVQNWLDNPASNFGWLMKYEDEISLGTAKQFFSSEAASVDLRPLLTIDFTPQAVPEPSSVLLLAAATLATIRFRTNFSRRRP